MSTWAFKDNMDIDLVTYFYAFHSVNINYFLISNLEEKPDAKVLVSPSENLFE